LAEASALFGLFIGVPDNLAGEFLQRPFGDDSLSEVCL
jgi:hypothetical protein